VHTLIVYIGSFVVPASRLDWYGTEIPTIDVLALAVAVASSVMPVKGTAVIIRVASSAMPIQGTSVGSVYPIILYLVFPEEAIAVHCFAP
jgi:hypothetical protein